MQQTDPKLRDIERNLERAEQKLEEAKREEKKINDKIADLQRELTKFVADRTRHTAEIAQLESQREMRMREIDRENTQNKR